MAHATPLSSKSRYLGGLQWDSIVWMQIYGKNEILPVNGATQAVLD